MSHDALPSCPHCGGTMELQPVGGEGGHELLCCASCGGVLVGRRALLELRKVELPAWLADAGSEPQGPQGPTGGRRCPTCGEWMGSFAYRGGATEVERCSRCDHLFLDRGELARILREHHEGIEVSPEARAFLQGFREEALWRRIKAADVALGSLGLVALLFFLYMVLDPHYSHRVGYHYFTVPVPLAVVIAAGYYLIRRHLLRRQRRRDRRQLGRVRREHRQQRGGAGPSAPGGATPAASSPRRSKPERARCPWCGAAVEAGATHCAACDSDIF